MSTTNITDSVCATGVTVVTKAVAPATETSWANRTTVNVVVAEAQTRLLPPAAQVKSRRQKVEAHQEGSPKKTEKTEKTTEKKASVKSANAGKSGNKSGPKTGTSSAATGTGTKASGEKPKGEQRPPKPACTVCVNDENKSCLLCNQKGRDEISKTHCMSCCIYCSHCDRKGHQLYNEDGSVQCFKMRKCEICTEVGHDSDHCRRDWCETCRDDGKGHNFVGHTSERCRKNHQCTVCGKKGHLEDRCKVCQKCGRPGHLQDTCRTCEKCNQTGHITEQCEREKLCSICDKVGHSDSRCRACKYCGFALPGKDATWEHKCKRNNDNSCKECGGVGVGKCGCYDYVL